MRDFATAAVGQSLASSKHFCAWALRRAIFSDIAVLVINRCIRLREGVPELPHFERNENPRPSRRGRRGTGRGSHLRVGYATKHSRYEPTRVVCFRYDLSRRGEADVW
jgi:hypothetical protein